ncbi:elafin [Sturnira hondurensis]|uniref:elafin n=1 Tax=Sturnira hondurensis TaxID=192404 RepID=UPI001879543B|nr:elafin [Sturnira hondurensis]
MRPGSYLVLVVLVVLGALAVHAAVVGAVPSKGQEADKGHGPVKGQGLFAGQHPAKGKGPSKTQGPHKIGTKPGTCPKTLIKCAMMNPPNACLWDSQCQGHKKCCEGSCGKACMTPH